MWVLSKSGEQKLSTCNTEIQLIIRKALQISPIDFGVSCGHRTVEQQQIEFKAGRSHLDGINKKSKHNLLPSKGIDLYAYVNGKADYSDKYMGILAGVILSIAKDMGIELEWGGNWKSLKDMPHYNTK